MARAAFALALLVFAGLCLADARAFEQRLEREGRRLSPQDAGVAR